MASQLQREIDKLRKSVLTLGALVEEQLRLTFEVVRTHDVETAARVVDGDLEIDLMEIDVEEDCLKLLALYQPVASDLRMIIAVVKINTTLERVGDLAVNVARHAADMASHERPGLTFDLRNLIDKAQCMFSAALDSLMKGDADLARDVVAADDEVDDLDDELNRELRAAMRDHPEWVDGLMSLLYISRYIERLADHATNIAEDVVYVIDGEIPRHHVKRQAAEARQRSGGEA
jgi:phosphate transport system protein